MVTVTESGPLTETKSWIQHWPWTFIFSSVLEKYWLGLDFTNCFKAWEKFSSGVLLSLNLPTGLKNDHRLKTELLGPITKNLMINYRSLNLLYSMWGLWSLQFVNFMQVLKMESLRGKEGLLHFNKSRSVTKRARDKTRSGSFSFFLNANCCLKRIKQKATGKNDTQKKNKYVACNAARCFWAINQTFSKRTRPKVAEKCKERIEPIFTAAKVQGFVSLSSCYFLSRQLSLNAFETKTTVIVVSK